MNKQKVVGLSALALIAIVGTAGLGALNTVVHAQSQPAQVQQVAPKETVDAAEKPAGAETAEPANEPNLPGGGHQDTNGAQADHQFEGVE